MSVETTGDLTYGYLRLRSNKASDETITLKIYDKKLHKETLSSSEVAFIANKVMGYPSVANNVNFGDAELGDVNEDGKITIADITLLIDYLSGNKPNGFCIYTADANNDGTVDLQDIKAISNQLLEQEESK